MRERRVEAAGQDVRAIGSPRATGNAAVLTADQTQPVHRFAPRDENRLVPRHLAGAESRAPYGARVD